MSKLGSVCRRVYRIFSHAYFHHRRIFDEFEGQRHLCNRFTQFVTKYALMSIENLLVPFDEAAAAGGSNVDSNVVAAGAVSAAAAAAAGGAAAAAATKSNAAEDAAEVVNNKQTITSDGGGAGEQPGESDA